MKRLMLSIGVALALAGCDGSSDPTDAGVDAGAAVDAGSAADAGGGADAGGADAGPTADASVGDAGGDTDAGDDCTPLVCRGENVRMQVDPVAAFARVQGSYRVTSDGCSAASLAGEWVSGSHYTLQIDSGGSIFLTSETGAHAWSYLAPGDCDFACETTSDATWIELEDDSGDPPTVSFGYNNGPGTGEVFFVRAPDANCVFIDPVTL